MTFSKDDRDLNKRLAFDLMLAELDDRCVFEVDVYIDAPPFGDKILKTTWSDLEDHGFIVRPRSKGFNGYQLNSDGWIHGLTLLNRLHEPALEAHIQKLMATLKGYITKSREDAFVPLQQVIMDSEIPAGIVFNILDSGYIRRVLRRREADLERPGHSVHIPANFGLPL